jgi:hypothetical protein
MLTQANQPQTLRLKLPRPHVGQREIIDNAARFNVTANGRRWGKTYLMGDRLIKPMLNGYPVGWFAPTYKVLDDAWRYFKQVLEPIISKKDEQDYYLELITGGKIEFWSMDKGGVVARSRKYKEVALDECGQIADLEHRFEYEIRPTLIDFQGGAWFGGTPNGITDFLKYFEKEKDDPEWKSWQKPSWENPLLPLKEREEMKHRALVLMDPVARQEYGAEFLDSDQGFVPASWVDACAKNNDWWKPLDPYTPICVGIDVGTKNDLFAITGWGRDGETRKYKPAFVKIFHPEDLTTGGGIVTFAKPKEFLRSVARNYHVLTFAYDPYQCQGMADDLYQEGLGMFEEFTQGQKRTLADSLLYTLIRDRDLEWSLYDEDCKEMAQHIKNANAKIEGEDKRRLVKRTDALKIDSAVASSMAIASLQEFNV